MVIARYKNIIALTGGILLLRLTLSWLGYFPFTWDFGRDMLWVRQLTIEHKPMLVGAWGSLEGTFFGPAYFYLLTIPMWLSGGDPRAAVMMVSCAITALIPFGYWCGKRWFNSTVGWWWALLFALMPLYTQLSLYSFPQQLIPLIFMGLIASLWELWQQPKNSLLFLSGLMASFIFHFEPVDTPIGYITLFAWIAFMMKKQSFRFTGKSLAALLSGLSLPLLPNLLYDLRHNWGQAKALWSLIAGTDTSLGGGMSLWQRLIDRPINIGTLVARSLTALTEPWLGIVIIILLGYLIIRKKIKTPFLHLLGIQAVAAFLYLLIFPRLLKDYYLYFIPILVTLVLGLILAQVETSKTQSRLIYFVLLVILMMGQWKVISGLVGTNDVTTYRYQQQVTSTIYSQAAGQAFNAYVYTPVVYDYPYQYLFWWWGKNAYGYIPVEYAYKPNQPGYVYKKEVFDKNIPTHTDGGNQKPLTFLILESGDHMAYSRSFWRSLYSSTVIKEINFPAGLQLLQVQ